MKKIWKFSAKVRNIPHKKYKMKLLKHYNIDESKYNFEYRNVVSIIFMILLGFVIFRISNYNSKLKSYRNDFLFMYLSTPLMSYFEDHGSYPVNIDQFNKYAFRDFDTNFVLNTSKYLDILIKIDSANNIFSIKDKGFSLIIHSDNTKKINELKTSDALFYNGKVELFSDSLYTGKYFRLLNHPIFLKDEELIPVDSTFNLYENLNEYREKYLPESSMFIYIPGTIIRKPIVVRFSRINNFEPEILYSEVQNIQDYKLFFEILQNKINKEFGDKIDKAIIPIQIIVGGDILPI